MDCGIGIKDHWLVVIVKTFFLGWTIFTWSLRQITLYISKHLALDSKSHVISPDPRESGTVLTSYRHSLLIFNKETSLMRKLTYYSGTAFMVIFRWISNERISDRNDKAKRIFCLANHGSLAGHFRILLDISYAAKKLNWNKILLDRIYPFAGHFKFPTNMSGELVDFAYEYYNRVIWSTALQLWAIPYHIISYILVNLVTAKDCYQLINLWILNLCQLANTRPYFQTSLNDAIVCKVWALKSMVMIELIQKDTILSQVKWITWKSWNEIK